MRNDQLLDFGQGSSTHTYDGSERPELESGLMVSLLNLWRFMRLLLQYQNKWKETPALCGVQYIELW